MIGAAASAAVTAAKAAVAIHVPLAASKPPMSPVIFYNPKSGEARPSASNWPMRPVPVASSRSSSARHRPRPACPRRHCPRPPTGWRWPVATAPRPSSPRSHPSPVSPTPHFRRHPQPLRARPRRRSRRRRRRPRRLRRRRRAPVDLAEVNGRVFVNNVSLGLYAEAVQPRGLSRGEAEDDPRHRCPTRSGPGRGLDLRWTGPGGHEHSLGRGDPGLQQPLPTRQGRRFGDAAAHRRRSAGDHRRRRADRRVGRPQVAPATLA